VHVGLGGGGCGRAGSFKEGRARSNETNHTKVFTTWVQVLSLLVHVAGCSRYEYLCLCLVASITEVGIFLYFLLFS
jgi:hypothetical protein